MEYLLQPFVECLLNPKKYWWLHILVIVFGAYSLWIGNNTVGWIALSISAAILICHLCIYGKKMSDNEKSDKEK